MNVTKEQIAAVRKEAYAKLEVRRQDIANGKVALLVARGESGNLSLRLEEVNTGRGLGKKAIRDTYRIDGKVVAKSKILNILPE